MLTAHLGSAQMHMTLLMQAVTACLAGRLKLLMSREYRGSLWSLLQDEQAALHANLYACVSTDTGHVCNVWSKDKSAILPDPCPACMHA